jgi:hypothetical protein
MSLPGSEKGDRQPDWRKSGAEIGAANVQRLKSYLDRLANSGSKLPSQNGKVNASAVALACGFDRAVLYQNPGARQMLRQAAARLGLDAQVASRKAVSVDPRDQRILKLEQENANLKAEVFELRRNLRRLQHVEEVMIETGRRVSP